MSESKRTVTDGRRPTAEPEGPAADHEAEAPGPSIRMSAAAVENVREMIDDAALDDEGGLRITARTGAGCSAPLQYDMVLEEAPEADDTVLTSGGVRLFLDPESAWILDGLFIDYVTSSPLGEGFAFRHPRGPGSRSC